MTQSTALRRDARVQIGRIEVEGPDRRYQLSYTDWGAPGAARTVLCVHGLTRNGRDFDHLAAALAANARVICPDAVGRGHSDRLDDAGYYALPTYAAHMRQLIERLGLGPVDWVGTSMGGLIGMAVAAGEHSPIRRLVLNDIGPFLPKAALGRIDTYLGLARDFADLAEVEAHLREVHAMFGPLTGAQWRHLAAHSARARADGRLELAYDPRIREAFEQGGLDDVDLWPLWDPIRCPVLVLRGADSDLLLPETAREMTERGPRAKLVEFAGIGHAPALMAEDQIATVRDWLFA